MDWISNWLSVKAALLFSAISGAVIHVTVFWQHPKIALRQFLACMLVGINFGPVMVSFVTQYIGLTSEASENATICATGLVGLYLVEGLVAAAKRWSANPFFPKVKP